MEHQESPPSTIKSDTLHSAASEIADVCTSDNVDVVELSGVPPISIDDNEADVPLESAIAVRPDSSHSEAVEYQQLDAIKPNANLDVGHVEAEPAVDDSHIIQPQSQDDHEAITVSKVGAVNGSESDSAPNERAQKGRAILDIEDLTDVEGWEYFLNEAELSSSTLRCAANAVFMLDGDQNNSPTAIATIDVPSEEVMFWNKQQLEELSQAVERFTAVECAIRIREVKGVENTVLQRQNLAHEQWQDEVVVAFRDNAVVQKLMNLNGAMFDPNRIRFHEEE